MEKKTWISIIILIVIIMLLVLFRVPGPYIKGSRAYIKGSEPYIKKEEKSYIKKEGKPYIKGRCGCVFDIDDTLTCGDPAAVVRMCKENGCVLGLNTARNMPYALDIPLKEQGFPPNVLNSEDFVYNADPTFDNVVSTKVKGLHDFQQKWKIDSPSRILFFDDNLSNIEGANAAGFTGVWCSKTGQQCGIGPGQEKITAEFFRTLV